MVVQFNRAVMPLQISAAQRVWLLLCFPARCSYLLRCRPKPSTFAHFYTEGASCKFPYVFTNSCS